MGFNLLRFHHNGVTTWGVQRGEYVLPFASDVAELRTLIENGYLETARALAQREDPSKLALADVEILSPVTRPTRLLALGVNYHKHREEAGASKHPKRTLFFRKDDSSITSSTGDVVQPAEEPLLDYEVEMGLVMKKPLSELTQVTTQNVSDYVAGMVLVNDISARLTMIAAPFGQWYRGKGGRTLRPVGPSIYIFDEGEETKIHGMQLKLWVNDELRQDARTKDLISKPEEALSEASSFVNLDPGDVLLTGTPGGVAFRAPANIPEFLTQVLPNKERLQEWVAEQLESGKFLKEGDVVCCTLTSTDGSVDCGEQRNRVVS